MRPILLGDNAAVLPRLPGRFARILPLAARAGRGFVLVDDNPAGIRLASACLVHCDPQVIGLAVPSDGRGIPVRRRETLPT